MEEVLTNSDTVRTGWIILLVQLVITIMVAIFIIRKARLELDKAMMIQSNHKCTESGLDIVICEK